MTSRKELYREHCSRESSIPIFSKDWWLDAVCGENNWDVCLVERGGRIIGTMPYYMRKLYGFTQLTQPPLTQKLGPWILPSQATYAKRLAYENSVMGELLDQLPRFHYFNQCWHYKYTNWLPFYWDDYYQTTRYTYVLDYKNIGDLWGNLSSRVRGDVRKAQNKFNIKVKISSTLDEFLALNNKTYKRQGLKVPYSDQLVSNIDRACGERNCRKILIGEDDEGLQHAGAYIIWDDNSAYYLMGGIDPDIRNSGANSLVVWDSILYAATVTERFDFEGSMIKSVERFFRAFGAVQTQYFYISKTPSRILRIREYSKQNIK